MRIYFPDTNFFIQCRVASELPWGEVAPGEDILLLVSRTVQQELDRLKQAGNDRRTRRARIVSALFRKILENDNLRITIRDETQRVEIGFAPPIDSKRLKPGTLDLSRADDRIAEEVIAYRTVNKSEDVWLLTDDTNLMLTAKHHQLPFLAVPENWLLEPEPDERDRAILDLNRRVGLLEEHSPKLKLEVKDANGDKLDKLQMNVISFDSLSAKEIKELSRAVETQHPMALEFEGYGRPLPQSVPPGVRSTYFWHYEKPSEAEITQYKNVEYPKWQASLKQLLENLPTTLAYPSRLLDIAFVLMNEGARPAENVIVEFSALGDILFYPPAESEDGDDEVDRIVKRNKIIIPHPPAPPKARYVDPLAYDPLSSAALLRNMPMMHVPQHRDRYSFYWRDRPAKFADNWTFTCDEFRHKANPETFDLTLFIPPSAQAKSAAVRCRIMVSNLAEPLLVTIPVRITYTNEKVLEAAKKFVGEGTLQL